MKICKPKSGHGIVNQEQSITNNTHGVKKSAQSKIKFPHACKYYISPICGFTRLQLRIFPKLLFFNMLNPKTADLRSI